MVSRKLDTFCHLTVHCKLHRATCSCFDTIPVYDKQTDGIDVASKALAM